MNSRAEANIFTHMFATLYEITETGVLSPYLANNVSCADDGKEITFTLNEGLTCHDGEPLTAEDVAYTFNRAGDDANGFTGNTAGFVFDSAGFIRAEAASELDVTIYVDRFQSVNHGLLSEVFIHCKDSYEMMSLEEAAQNPIGSGPYEFVEWVPDSHMIMDKVEGFTLRDAGYDRIVWRVIPEASTRVAELIVGNVDVISNVVPDQADAVDVPTICVTLLGTECERASSMVNKPNDNPNLEPYPYDPMKAGELLDAAGYPADDGGLRFHIVFQAGSGRYLNDANVVQAIAQYLTDVGVIVDLQMMDWSSEFVPALRQHNVGPLYFVGTGGGTWNAQYDMADISTPTGATNYTEWSNPEWFALRETLAAPSLTAEETQDIVNQMLEVMYNDPPWLFLYFQPDSTASATVSTGRRAATSRSSFTVPRWQCNSPTLRSLPHEEGGTSIHFCSPSLILGEGDGGWG